MTKNTISMTDIYILPSFFTSMLEKHDLTGLENAYNNNNFDQYTEIRSLSNIDIASKFRELRYIPLSNGDLDYESDSWDFSSYTIVNNKHDTLNFHNISPVYKNTLKDYILLLILKGNVKLATIVRQFINLRPFLNSLEKRGVTNISDVDASDVKSFFTSIKVASRTFISYQWSIKKMLQFYDVENDTQVYTTEINNLCERMEFKQLRAEIRNNSRKPIPDKYFNNLLKVLITMMDNTFLDIDTRAKAAMLVIDSQTGLRASELSLLRANSVETISIDNFNYRMIHYKIIKTAKGNTGYTNNITYINDVSFKAYEVLMKVYKENRVKRESDLLYCPNYAALPANSAVFLNFLKKVCVINADEIGSKDPIYKEVLSGSVSAKEFSRKFYASRPIHNTPLTEVKNVKEETVFYHPVVHQFRNTVVDRLLKKGVELDFVRQYMGHLSMQMTASYVSYNDTDIQENLKFSEKVLRTYLTGDARILGSTSQSLMNRIDEWIENNDLNVGENLDCIVEKLLKIIPIRSKQGGMCIKGTKLTDACSVDSKTDEFFCAYGVCPNVCHFYFMINVTYSDFKSSVDIYNHNKNHGFNRQAEKEFNKIKYLVAQRFMPEISELERELRIKGETEVVKRHSELKYIIENIIEIKKEIKKWV